MVANKKIILSLLGVFISLSCATVCLSDRATRFLSPISQSVIRIGFSHKKEKLTKSELEAIKGELTDVEYQILLLSEDKYTIYIGEILPETRKAYPYRKIHFSEIDNMWLDEHTQTLQFVYNDRIFGKGSWLIANNNNESDWFNDIQKIYRSYRTWKRDKEKSEEERNEGK